MSPIFKKKYFQDRSLKVPHDSSVSLRLITFSNIFGDCYILFRYCVVFLLQYDVRNTFENAIVMADRLKGTLLK